MSEGTEKRIVLSLTKLTSLLSKYSYTLTSTYCVGSDVYFIEARTPKFQKTFIVHIPPKYQMKCDDDTHKRFQITPVSADIVSSRQQDYLMEIKGPLIDCDLLSISSTVLCLYKNNGNLQYYKIGDFSSTSDAVPLEDAELGDVEQIVKDTAEIMKILEPEEIAPAIEEPSELDDAFLTQDDLKNMTLVRSLPKEETEPEAVELEFEDTTGEAIDDSVHLMTENPEVQPPAEVKPKKKKSPQAEVVIEEPPKEVQTPKRRDNPLPPTLEDAEIGIGIVYYSIDIGIFYKRAENLEEDILSIYNTLDDNEDDLRGTKITEITLLTEKIIQKIKNDVEANRKKEIELKTQLLTLSSILEKTESFNSRMSKDKKKFTDIKPELDRIQTQTKTTIYDINVELLRTRDTIDNLLDSIQTSLEEILSI